ncbi:MAG: hypothetical protein E7435_02835 [Ruminococcaceae bacterium]|nr:hypothetical protein [Oscillospiraceae bacterium]
MMEFKRQEKSALRRIWTQPPFPAILERCGYFLSGFCLCAASLGNGFLPLAMGFICACTGANGVAAAVGGALGYYFFWGGGIQPVAWCASALLLSAVLGDRQICREAPLLLPMAAALTVALWGVLFQALSGDKTPVALYLLRILMALSSCGVSFRVLRERNPLFDWFACGFAVLALAQILPLPYIGLGYIAAGALVVRGAFPAAALSGLALDLAGITPLPMTAIVCLSYLIRFLPRQPLWLGGFGVVSVSSIVMYICGVWDLSPVPGLFLGAMAGVYLPTQAPKTHKRGEIGLAQVRLELAAGVLTQTRQLLSGIPEIPIDTDLLIQRAVEGACNSCTCRKNCKDVNRVAQMPGTLLHQPLQNAEELPVICKKSGRLLAQLHKSQEQFRTIAADRQRQREYRAAVVQQYGFLSGYLQELSDSLTHKIDCIENNFHAETRVYCNRPAVENGDRCLRFMGTGGKYYVILCDGMGSGPEAAQEARTGCDLLRQLLLAGYPTEHALGSLNSICALRDRAGILTVDLVELRLDTGIVSLYKWGAAPSYLITDGTVEKIGVPTPPPGLSASGWQAPARRVNLGCGELLLLVSDGVGEEAAIRICREKAGAPEDILARCLVDCGTNQGDDDATVVCIRLREE